jgi:hypothetical protein
MGELTLIHTQVAEGSKEEGAPHGRKKAAKCGMRAATSPTLITCVKPKVKGRRVCYLLRVWAATSKVRHLSKRGAPLNKHVPISSKIQTQLLANHMDVVPLDYLFDFAFILSSILSPHIFFIFALANFY